MIDVCCSYKPINDAFVKKVCALMRHASCAPLAPSAVAVRQQSTRQSLIAGVQSAHPQRSVFFYTIGKELSYRIKKPRPCKRTRLCPLYHPLHHTSAAAGQSSLEKSASHPAHPQIIWLPVTEEFRLRLLGSPLSARSSEVIFPIPYSHRPSTRAGSL